MRTIDKMVRNNTVNLPNQVDQSPTVIINQERSYFFYFFLDAGLQASAYVPEQTEFSLGFAGTRSSLSVKEWMDFDHTLQLYRVEFGIC